eukprot:TRINITY_DN14623_c0_g1_i4.p1 TRINITY_DN14623_c0_g1~~TRINITY_DN14623_c0_g1_i4.p1  ORF type:complete len:317 (+),score=111.74 TRINITY_DN14623_c0_g1_i4:109-1059(+)
MNHQIVFSKCVVLKTEREKKGRKLLDEFSASFNLEDAPADYSPPLHVTPTSTCGDERTEPSQKEEVDSHPWESIAFHVGTLEKPSMMLQSLQRVLEKKSSHTRDGIKEEEQTSSSKKPLIQVVDLERGKDIKAREQSEETAGEGDAYVYDVYMVENGMQGGEIKMETERKDGEKDEGEENWNTRVYINGVEPFDMMYSEIPSVTVGADMWKSDPYGEYLLDYSDELGGSGSEVDDGGDDDEFKELSDYPSSPTDSDDEHDSDSSSDSNSDGGIGGQHFVDTDEMSRRPKYGRRRWKTSDCYGMDSDDDDDEFGDDY